MSKIDLYVCFSVMDGYYGAILFQRKASLYIIVVCNDLAQIMNWAQP
jgi:hypothetical protein